MKPQKTKPKYRYLKENEFIKPGDYSLRIGDYYKCYDDDIDSLVGWDRVDDYDGDVGKKPKDVSYNTYKRKIDSNMKHASLIVNDRIMYSALIEDTGSVELVVR